MQQRRKYRVEGINNKTQKPFSKEVTAWNGQYAFRAISSMFPDIVDMKAYRLD